MKRLFSLSLLLCFFATVFYAQEEGDVYDDGYVYEQNGAGDQFLKVNLAADFPLNFNKQLYVGGSASIGYYQFLTNNIAVGGEVEISYNVSIGNKPLLVVPLTLGVIFQPYINKFEFPLSLNLGITTTTCQGMTYFPGFVAKATAGAFYRINEGWSLGLNGTMHYTPQFFNDSSKNFHGLFATLGIGGRYHF